ncbi:MAG: STAS domain-containing protein [Chitinophagaceae bacterium]|nr:anti-sigma factor antagonist [Chitinophagaceae bacterium]MCB0739676.1 anti-sigma factor antagonist [Chitinophagaceae bacterium]HQV06092.1 STAS domain-containing protein [Chitinophagaceae bacterium]
MNVKCDTKEKFHVITVTEPALTATMTAAMEKCFFPYLENNAGQTNQPDEIINPQVKNLVLVLREVQSIDETAARKLVHIQQKFYESNVSFVICEMQKAVEEFLDEQALLELMNVTPTESEAWDIVQMEEIERELFSDDGN